jgi:hypothetical protein
MEWQVNENGGVGDVRRDCWRNIAITLNDQRSKREIAFYEKVIKVKADVAAYLINCFPSA